MPKSFEGPEGDVLGARHLGLVFFLYSAAVVGSVAVLVTEVACRKVFRRIFGRSERV